MCKASGIKENTSCWTSDNYTTKSHEKKVEEAHNLAKEQENKELLKETVMGVLRSMFKELLGEAKLVGSEVLCEGEGERLISKGYFPT